MIGVATIIIAAAANSNRFIDGLQGSDWDSNKFLLFVSTGVKLLLKPSR